MNSILYYTFGVISVNNTVLRIKANLCIYFNVDIKQCEKVTVKSTFYGDCYYYNCTESTVNNIMLLIQKKILNIW